VALDLKTLIVRRSLRLAGLNLVFASVMFGLSVAVAWYAWREDAPMGAPLLFLAIAAFWGVTMGQQFRDQEPKVIVGRDGLELPGVAPAPIPWDKIEEVALGTGIRALGGGRLDVFLDAGSFVTLKLGNRWMGDPIVKRPGIRPGFTILGAGLDAKTRAIFDAMRRHWPPEETPRQG
jgi:hypothetical protein